MRLKIKLTEKALSDLHDAVAEEKEAISEGRWLFQKALKQTLKNVSETKNLLIERGSLVLPDGKILSADELVPMPIDSDEEGNVEMVLGDRTQAHLEAAAGYVKLTNQRMGIPVRWSTAREWIVELSLAEIAKAAAKAEAEEIEEEERASYSSAKTG